jgi:hypothetical protein
LLQALDGFADGRSTDLEPVGQRALDKAFAWREVTRDDGRPEPAVDLVEDPSDASDGQWVFQFLPPSWPTGRTVVRFARTVLT